MVLLVLKAHGALNFSGGVDKFPQWVARQRVVIAASINVVERAGFDEGLLRVDAIEQETLDLVRGVQRIAVGLELRSGILL